MKGVKTNIVVLPSDFHPLAYIQSKDNKCYIDTGVINKNVSIEMGFTASFSNADCLWCSRTSLDANSFTLFLIGGAFRLDIGGAKYTVAKCEYNADYVIKADDNGQMWINGTKVKDAKPAVFTEYNYITLFDSRIGSGAPTLSDNNNANIKLKGCRIYKNSQLVRDFIPALNSNGVAGLLDTVNIKFYVSPNGAAFDYG